MKHVLHTCNEERCFICAGGLALCIICDGAEGDMPTDCPGKLITGDRLQLIYDKQLDFKDGRWHVLKPIAELKR